VTQRALLVMDVQEMVVARYPDPGYLPRLKQAIDAARAQETPVIYVTVAFRSGAPEVSRRNRMFGRLAGAVDAGRPNPVHPAVAPGPGDVVVTKRRVSGFAGSDLDLVLRAGGIEHLVLTGIATSGVVLSTLLEAADADYRTIVIADCCADSDADLHRVLIERLFPLRGEVTTAADFIKALANLR